jgi:cation transport protein ChaC
VSGSPDTRTLWVFGYGSLMWQPGFAFVEMRRARLFGYHRSFCIYSLHYRGTPERPGLVLGLARGGTCQGVAFRVADADASAVRSYLHARELIYGVYREAILTAEIDSEQGPIQTDVLTYIAETGHPSFAGTDISMARTSAIIRAARGKAGSNLAYFVATLSKLRELSIRQPDLERLAVTTRTGGSFGCTASPRNLEARHRAFASRPRAIRSAVRHDRRHAFAYRRRLNP